MKLSEAAEKFYISMIGIKSPKTVTWYKGMIGALIQFLGDPGINTIDLYALERFRASLDRPSRSKGSKGKKISTHTIHCHVRAQKHFFKWLYQRQLIEKNPAEFLEKPRLPKQQRKGIKVEAAEKMLDMSRGNSRDYAILLFVRDTGCRAGGIYNLLTENLDIMHNTAIVREKGDKERSVYFTTETALALAMYNSVRENPFDEEHFFLAERTHEPLTYSGVYQIFKRLGIKAKIKTKHSPHQWRHAAARSWLKAGMNLKTTGELLGHESEKTTGDMYGTLDDEERRELYYKTQAVIHAKLNK